MTDQGTETGDRTAEGAAPEAYKTHYQEMERFAIEHEFAGLSEVRRKELDRICGGPKTFSEFAGESELMDEYYKNESAKLSPEDAQNLFLELYVPEALETSEDLEPVTLGKIIFPRTPLETEYVQWRQSFVAGLHAEELANRVYATGRENRELQAATLEQQRAIKKAADDNAALLRVVELKQAAKPAPKKKKKRAAGRKVGLKPLPSTLEILEQTRSNLSRNKAVLGYTVSRAVKTAIRDYEQTYGEGTAPGEAAIRRHLRNEHKATRTKKQQM